MSKEKCTIHSLDSVWTEIDPITYSVLNNLMSYEYDVWLRSRWGRTKKKGVKRLLNKFSDQSYMMLTGYVDKCLDFLLRYEIPYEYSSDIKLLKYDEPHIDGITIRPYQDSLINNALEFGRGVIQAPTGSGKSIIIIGIMSAFSQENILFLVHTTDLVYQMKAHLEKYNMPCGVWTGKDKYLNRITVATVQAYKRIAREHSNLWDVIIIDEGHHVTSHTKGNYYEALSVSAAPCKLAFTATMPEKVEAKWALEGLIGPKIGELTMAEGTELGFLATPIIKMIGLESPVRMWGITDYNQAYNLGIVKNSTRNSHIAAEAELEMEKGGTVLILVTRIAHANEIQKNIKFHTEIIKGAVSKNERERIKSELKSGEIGCVIATVAWCEGVDIPNLTCVINAGGGKSEIQILQKIGRGLRKTKNKDSVLIVDFMDRGNKHLEKHSRTRKEVYGSQGWEVKND